MQAKAFPEFEMHIKIPLGMSYITPYAKANNTGFMEQVKPYVIDYGNIEEAAGPNTGFVMQVGNSFDLKNETGLTSISLLADVGYYLESSGATFIGSSKFNTDDYITDYLTLFHTLNIGIIPKINFYFPNMKIPFSVGFGGGVKIPFSGKKYLTTKSGEEIEETLSYQDIRKTFLYPFIPYIKLTYDTYFYVSDSVALTFGLYMSYDFGMQYDTEKLNAEGSASFPLLPVILELAEYGYTSFDVGISLGIYFGRENPKPKKEVL